MHFFREFTVLNSFDTPIPSLASCRGEQNADAR
jgi:hypothetical protein